MLRLLTVCLTVGFAQTLFAAEPQSILLWPNGAPGSEGKTADEVVETTGSGERNITSVHKPSLTPYLPDADKANGVAIVIAPGGGHSKLCMDHEGHNLAKWLAEHGVAAFILKYRLCREKDSTYTLEGHAVADMQRAIRLVRNQACESQANRSSRFFSRWGTRIPRCNAGRHGRSRRLGRRRQRECSARFSMSDLSRQIRSNCRYQGNAPSVHRVRIRRPQGYFAWDGRSLFEV